MGEGEISKGSSKNIKWTQTERSCKGPSWFNRGFYAWEESLCAKTARFDWQKSRWEARKKWNKVILRSDSYSEVVKDLQYKYSPV